MARTKLGVLVVGIRGTVGGITHSANKSGTYCKAWSRGARTPTEAQNAGRANLSTMGALWAALDAGDKTDWENFAADPNELDYDQFGDQYWLSGFGWFTRAQMRRMLVGEDPDGDVPSGAAASAPTGLAVTASNGSPGTVEIAWDSATFGATDSVIAFMVPSFSAGAAWITSGWLLVLALENPGDTGEDVSSEFATLFGDLTAGQRIYSRIYKQALEGNRSVKTDLVTEVT